MPERTLRVARSRLTDAQSNVHQARRRFLHRLRTLPQSPWVVSFPRRSTSRSSSSSRRQRESCSRTAVVHRGSTHQGPDCARRRSTAPMIRPRQRETERSGVRREIAEGLRSVTRYRQRFGSSCAVDADDGSSSRTDPSQSVPLTCGRPRAGRCSIPGPRQRTSADREPHL
jgi:hypothetical protein